MDSKNLQHKYSSGCIAHYISLIKYDSEIVALKPPSQIIPDSQDWFNSLRDKK